MQFIVTAKQAIALNAQEFGLEMVDGRCGGSRVVSLEEYNTEIDRKIYGKGRGFWVDGCVVAAGMTTEV